MKPFLFSQDLFVDYVPQDVFASFNKYLESSSQHGSADCHIELSMCKHFLNDIDSDSSHALSLSFVDRHCKTYSDWELDPYHGPWRGI